MVGKAYGDGMARRRGEDHGPMSMRGPIKMSNVNKVYPPLRLGLIVPGGVWLGSRWWQSLENMGRYKEMGGAIIGMSSH